MGSANLFGSFDRRQLANLEQVLGPLTQENARIEVGAWWLRGVYRGRPVWLGLSDRGVIRGIEFSVPLAGRPIHLSIHDRRRTVILGTPEVRTGDPRFDEEFLVSGWPPEAIVQALDAEARAWLLSTYAGRDPQLSTHDDRLGLFRSLATFSGGLGVSPDAAMPPAEVAYWLDVVCRLADSLVAAFDRAHAAIAREQGAAAASAWLQAQVAAFATRDRSRVRLRALVLGGLAAFLVLTLVAILLLVFRC